MFDVGSRAKRPLRDWGDLEEDGDDGKGLEELEEWVPYARENVRPPVQEYGDVEMDEADTGIIITDNNDEELRSPSTRFFLYAGSNEKSKHRPAPSTSTRARFDNEADSGFIRDADNEGFDEADTGFHVDEDEMEEDMSFGFVLSGRSGVSYNWVDDNPVDEDEMNTGFIEAEGPSAEDEEDEAGVESGLLSLSQDSKAKDFNLSRKVSEALRVREDDAVFEDGWSGEADTGFHIEGEGEEDDYMDSQFFLPSSRSQDETNAAPVAGDRNPPSVDTSLPDVPIGPSDESPDIVMSDDVSGEDNDEDANTGFIDFKASLDTDEEDEEEGIDSRFILSDGDIQYHHGSISEILDADGFTTVQEVKEEEEMEKHIEGEYEEDMISEWATGGDEDDSKLHGAENGDYEYKGHPSTLLPIVRSLSPYSLLSSHSTSPAANHHLEAAHIACSHSTALLGEVSIPIFPRRVSGFGLGVDNPCDHPRWGNTY